MDNSLVSYLITGLLILLGVGGGVFYLRVLRPRVEANEWYKKYSFALHFIEEFVSQTVLRLAFSPEDLSAYQDEASRTGRDVRLVAAYHWVDDYTTSLGIELDENHIITLIEAKLAEFKVGEVIDHPNLVGVANDPAYEHVYDDPDELRRWGLLGLEAGRRAPVKKPKAKRK